MNFGSPQAEQATTLLNPSNFDDYLFTGPITVTAGSSQQVILDIEAGTVAGSPDKSNEDAFAVRRFGSSIAVAVFDGATSLKKVPAHDTIGMSGARFASHFLRDQFLNLRTFSERTLAELNARLGDAVSAFEGIDTRDVTTLPTSTATIALIDPDQDRVFIQHVSDSFALAKLHNGSPCLLTTDMLASLEERMCQFMRELAVKRGISNRDARSLPESQTMLIENLQHEFNRTDGKGVGVINGDVAVEPYIEYRSIALSSVQILLLGSDGLPAPQHPLSNLAEQSMLLEMIDSKGIEQTIDFKKREEDLDPDWTVARWKHSDDATGISIRIR